MKDNFLIYQGRRAKLGVPLFIPSPENIEDITEIPDI